MEMILKRDVCSLYVEHSTLLEFNSKAQASSHLKAPCGHDNKICHRCICATVKVMYTGKPLIDAAKQLWSRMLASLDS